MADFVVIAGVQVPIAEGQAVERVERRGGFKRAFAMNLLSDISAEKSVWGFTTAFLLQAEVDALKAATALGAIVPCSGAGLAPAGGTVNCGVEVGDGEYLNVATTDGLGYMRTLALVLYEE